MSTEPKYVYFVTKKAFLQYYDANTELRIVFGRSKRYKGLENSREVKYLRALEEFGKVPFREISEEEFSKLGRKTENPASMRARVLANLAMSRGGEPLNMGMQADSPKLAMASTATSPITGGQNPAGMQVSQADTIAALRAKLGGKKEEESEVEEGSK